ncbi:PHD-finger domain-containing protein [Phlyctema vagabunda]|uniref:PHD-finger domain-containing protein n=1 Tax=Phlyctema vagabunda TaxID=108571 RepID=A0ABR4P778_9HELO
MAEPEPEPEQCIICLEELDAVPAIHDDHLEVEATNTDASTAVPSKSDAQQFIAKIKPCDHILHNECLKSWSLKANSCPICRQAFNLVEVLDKVGGTSLSEYIVEDKKQVAEFDPNAWIEEEDEQEESDPCPICGKSDDEDVLLLCDLCSAPYHTYCIGLDRVPRGDWFCLECATEGAYLIANQASEALGDTESLSESGRNTDTYSGRDAPRTYGSVRRDRRRVRNDPWTGAWNQFSGRVLDIVGLDLDFYDDDQSMVPYRRHQRRTAQARSEFEQWQQRMNIAGRQGARNVFRAAAPPRVRSQLPTVPVETVEETKAWGAFEKAKEIDSAGPSNRKRKSRSVTASPAEQELPQEPERKLKRPRTRRVLDRPGSSSTAAPPTRPSRLQATGSVSGEAAPVVQQSDLEGAPSFLSSLLREVEMAPTSDDDTSRSAFSNTTNMPNRAHSPFAEYSSPATSPSPSSSNYATPRAMSITPPPHISKRPGSPVPLTSRVEPRFGPADYSPNRSPPINLQSNDRSGPSNGHIELKQPRPRRRREASLNLQEEQDSSPVRATMSIEAKEGINKIVKTALAPHWKSREITKDQYENINREVSRKLYEIAHPTSCDKSTWEKIATTEVTKAVEGLTG